MGTSCRAKQKKPGTLDPGMAKSARKSRKSAHKSHLAGTKHGLKAESTGLRIQPDDHHDVASLVWKHFEADIRETLQEIFEAISERKS